MFAKVTLMVIVSSAIGALAGYPSPPTGSVVAAQCNTGGAQCCNSVTSAKDPKTAALLGQLGIVVQAVDAVVGLGCTPITVVGGGVDCAQQPVCCQNNDFNGLVNVGCSPISL